MGESVCVFEFRYAKSNLHIGEYLNEASVDRHAPKNLSRMVHSVVEFHMSRRSFFLALDAAVSAFSLLATPTQANDGDRRRSLRGTENLTKRHKIAAACFNLSLLMRTLLGVPKRWMAGANNLLEALIAYLCPRVLCFS